MSGKDYIADYDCHDECEYMYDDFKSEMLIALSKMKKGKTGEYRVSHHIDLKTGFYNGIDEKKIEAFLV